MKADSTTSTVSFLLLLTILLSGCAANSGAAGERPAITPTQPAADAAPPAKPTGVTALDPCALLTVEEVAAAVGAPVAAAASETSPLSGARTCTYTSEKEPDVEGTLWLHTYRSGEPMANSNFTLDAGRLFEEVRSANTGGLTEVPSIGDSAYWVGAADPAGDQFISLEVLQKSATADVYFTLQMIPRPERIHTELEALAATAAARIP
jgi:hypothetical protein